MGPCLFSEGTHFSGDFLGIFGGARNADDIRAGVRETDSDGAADAATCARDHGHLVLQDTGHVPLFVGGEGGVVNSLIAQRKLQSVGCLSCEAPRMAAADCQSAMLHNAILCQASDGAKNP